MLFGERMVERSDFLPSLLASLFTINSFNRSGISSAVINEPESCFIVSRAGVRQFEAFSQVKIS